MFLCLLRLEGTAESGKRIAPLKMDLGGSPHIAFGSRYQAPVSPALKTALYSERSNPPSRLALERISSAESIFSPKGKSATPLVEIESPPEKPKILTYNHPHNKRPESKGVSIPGHLMFDHLSQRAGR